MSDAKPLTCPVCSGTGATSRWEGSAIVWANCPACTSAWALDLRASLAAMTERAEKAEAALDQQDRETRYVGSTARMLSSVINRIALAGEDADTVLADYQWEWDSPPDLSALVGLKSSLTQAERDLAAERHAVRELFHKADRYQKELTACYSWYDGAHQDHLNMLWAGGDEWGEWQNIRAANVAAEREGR